MNMLLPYFLPLSSSDMACPDLVDIWFAGNLAPYLQCLERMPLLVHAQVDSIPFEIF